MSKFNGFIGGSEKKFYDCKKTVDATGKILTEGGKNINGENITSIDLFYTPSELTPDEKLDLIAKNLKIKKEKIEECLPEISQYWQESKAFLKRFLGGEEEQGRFLPREIERMENFESVDSLTKVFSRTTHLKKKQSLGLAPYYCALASLMVAVSEYNKEEFAGLMEESEYLEKKLFEDDKTGVRRFHRIKEEEDPEWLRIGILLNDRSWINARFSYRGKSKDSILMKLANKPEFSASDIVKDGIGLKFEIFNKEEAEPFFVFLSHYIKENFSGEKIKFENTNFFSEEEKDKLVKKLEIEGVECAFEKGYASNKNFRSAKITGEIKIPQGGKEGGLVLARNFEIQVALTNNENETGLTQHSIYKRVQKLSLFTRLFGSFDENRLEAVCEEASQASGLSKKKIKKYIIDNYLVRISSSKKLKYMFAHHFFRWEKAGMIPEGLEINKIDRKRLEKEME